MKKARGQITLVNVDDGIQGDPGAAGLSISFVPGTIIINQQLDGTVDYSGAVAELKVLSGSIDVTGSASLRVASGTSNCDAEVPSGRKSVHVTRMHTSGDSMCREGQVAVYVTYGGTDHAMLIPVRVNLLGSFRTAIEEDVETSIASKVAYGYDNPGGELSVLQIVGKFIRSSEENSSRITSLEEKTKTDLLCARWEEWWEPTGTAGRIVYDLEHEGVCNGETSFIGSPVLPVSKGKTYCFSFFVSRNPQGKVTFFQHSKAATVKSRLKSGSGVTVATMTADTSSMTLNVGGEPLTLTRSYFTFTASADCYFGMRYLDTDSRALYRPRLVEGVTPSEVMVSESLLRQRADQIFSTVSSFRNTQDVRYASILSQLSDRITLAVLRNEVARAGIVLSADSEHGFIDMLADYFRLHDANNDTVLGIDTVTRELVMKGTIKATNFFHSVCFFKEGGIHSSGWYYIYQETDATVEAGLSVGDYVQLENTISGARPTTYSADLVLCWPSLQNWERPADERRVFLPHPADFEGKMVMVSGFNYGVNSGQFFVCCAAEPSGVSGFFSHGARHGNNGVEFSNRGSSCTLTTGGIAYFISVKEGGNFANDRDAYGWVLVENSTGGDIIIDGGGSVPTSVVRSVVGKTGDVAVSDIASALTGAGYKLTDTVYSHPTNGANMTIAAANKKVLSAITVDSQGHVTSVSSKTLAAADIPSLNASKITAGIFDVARIPDITVSKITDFPSSMPASDVYDWAKEAAKPSYTFSEIGNKPTTLAGYGITDAKINGGVITLGNNTITPITAHQTIYDLKFKNSSDNDVDTYAPATAGKTVKAGSNVTITASSNVITIAAKDTTYSSKAEQSGGTAVSLVTTGEKYTWNHKQDRYLIRDDVNQAIKPFYEGDILELPYAQDGVSLVAEGLIGATGFATPDGEGNNVLLDNGGVKALATANGIATLDNTGKVTSSQLPSLPTATSSVLGGVKVGSGLSIDNNGVLSATGVTSMGEAFLTWGGRNLAGDFSPTDAAMIADLGANRAAFMPAVCSTFEYSRDGGTSWTAYPGATDEKKTGFFSGIANSFTCGYCRTADGTGPVVGYQLRVTVDAYADPNHYLDTRLRKFVINVSIGRCKNPWCTIQIRTTSNHANNRDTWLTIANKVVLGGDGYNVINTSDFRIYHSSYYRDIRFIFGYDDVLDTATSSFVGLDIRKIFFFGGMGWTTPSNMAKMGHLYDYDASQNATFPAKVTATQFVKSGGTSSQILMADGSVKTTTDILSGYATQEWVGQQGYAKSNAIPTKVSDLTNDSGYLTADDVGQFITSSDLIWTKISGKPTTFTPATHSHDVFSASAAGFAPAASSTNKVTAETAVGNYYLCADGKYRQLPANAFKNTTYTFDGTYNSSTNKAATVDTVINAVAGKQDSLTVHDAVSGNDYSLNSYTTLNVPVKNASSGNIEFGFLKLTGGTISVSGIDSFVIKRDDTNYPNLSMIRFSGKEIEKLGYLGFTGQNELKVGVIDGNNNHSWKTILHEGNFSSYASISNGTITIGSNSVTPITSHQDITGKQDKVAKKGSTTKPVYTSAAGTFAECSDYAGGTAVTLNGTSKGASTASFYAPTDAGTNGQFLKSTGSGAPSWASLPVASQNTAGIVKMTSSAISGSAAGATVYSADYINSLVSGIEGGSNVYYGTCTSAAATMPKVCTVETFPTDGNGKPLVGTMISVKFSYTNSSTSTSPQLNVNGTGAASVWFNNAVLSATKSPYIGYANRYINYMWDGTYWVFMGHSTDNNSTYSQASLGQGYGEQNNSAQSSAVTVTLGSYTLAVGGIVSVKFLYNVLSSSTMNINGKGAKPIYNQGAAIGANVIGAGDVGTFIYNGTSYNLVGLWRAGDVQYGMKVGSGYVRNAASGTVMYLLVAECTYTTSQGTASKDISGTFLLTDYRDGNNNGILHVRARVDSGASEGVNTNYTGATIWSKGSSLDPNNFIMAVSYTEGTTQLKCSVFLKVTGGWHSTRFTLLDEGSWNTRLSNNWKMYDALYDSSNESGSSNYYPNQIPVNFGTQFVATDSGVMSCKLASNGNYHVVEPSLQDSVLQIRGINTNGHSIVTAGNIHTNNVLSAASNVVLGGNVIMKASNTTNGSTAYLRFDDSSGTSYIRYSNIANDDCLEYNSPGDHYFYNGSGAYNTLYALAFTQASDIRMKDVLNVVTLSVDDVAKAPAIKFKWKNENDRMQVGTLAQYWQSVLPETVRAGKDGMLSLDYATAAMMSAIILARKVRELEDELKRIRQTIN